MANKSPSRLKNRMARISRVAYRVLLERAMVNNTSIAEELDKALHLETYQLELDVDKALAYEVDKGIRFSSTPVYRREQQPLRIAFNAEMEVRKSGKR